MCSPVSWAVQEGSKAVVKRALLTGVAALLMATGTAHADNEKWEASFRQCHIRPWKTICECGIVGNLLPTFHCRRALSLLPSAAQRLRLGGPFSRRPWNLLEQPRIQASTFRGYPRIALWNTGATDDTVVTANIFHLPLSWCYPMSTVLSLRSRTCRCYHQQYGSPN